MNSLKLGEKEIIAEIKNSKRNYYEKIYQINNYKKYKKLKI